MTRPFLEVQGLSKTYPSPQGEPLTVFRDVNLHIQKGEFVCIIGHSGCGKSTILNVLAGLDTATGGAVIMDGHEVAGPSLDRGVVFQNYSLLPWLSALKNVTFAVKARWPNWSRNKITEHSYKYLEMVGLTGGAEHRKPHQLSGGMRQRVSIARAFAIQPKLLLLDEPFGALDALTRGVIQEELLRIWSGTDQTVFMITHDVDEAILLADRILLMTNGPLARVAEAVSIDIPRPRQRTTIIHDPNYYPIRNHLVEFLAKRSKDLAGTVNPDGDDAKPTVVQFPTQGTPRPVSPVSPVSPATATSASKAPTSSAKG